MTLHLSRRRLLRGLASVAALGPLALRRSLRVEAEALFESAYMEALVRAIGICPWDFQERPCHDDEPDDDFLPPGPPEVLALCRSDEDPSEKDWARINPESIRAAEEELMRGDLVDLEDFARELRSEASESGPQDAAASRSAPSCCRPPRTWATRALSSLAPPRSPASMPHAPGPRA